MLYTDKEKYDFMLFRNRWAMYGPMNMVDKVKGGWVIIGFNHPMVFKTKTKAMAAIDDYVLSKAANMRN